MNSIKHLEIQQCRTCYNSINNLQLLTSFVGSSIDQDGTKTYVQLLLEICNINVMDDPPQGEFPQFICLNCSNKLKSAHEFIEHTRKINQFLKSLADVLNTKSKVDFIEKPALDIPLEVKIEKDDDVEFVTNEREFLYSPIDTDTYKLQSTIIPNDKLDSNQEEELSKLLDCWNLGYMLDILKSEAVTVTRLKFLTEVDLDHLFKNKKIGEKAEFRFHLLEWKKQKGCCDVASVSSNVSNLSTNFSFEKPEYNISSENFNLQNIIKEHPTGDYVVKTFCSNKKLDDVARKILVDAIITWAIKTKLKLTKNMFERISVQIESEFCEDKEAYYRKIGSRSSGRLFDKYYNTIKRLKKSGEWDTPNINISSDIVKNENVLHAEIDETDVEKAYEWLKVFTEPWSEVTSNWCKCYSKRRNDIINAIDGNNIVEVLTQWKLFSHCLGYTLVEIDFNILYPTSHFDPENWEIFKSQIIPIFNKKVKDSGCLEYLKKINANDKGSEQLIFLLLHVILRPSIKRKYSNVIYRSTIKDSQNAFLLHSNTVNDVQNQLDELKTSLLKRGETLQPLIIAVGLDICNATFHVYYDDIKYELPSFLTSLDICFKMFQVLNLKYPRDCAEVWTFIQRYFYCIKLKEDIISPNILCLINDLK